MLLNEYLRSCNRWFGEELHFLSLRGLTLTIATCTGYRLVGKLLQAPSLLFSVV